MDLSSISLDKPYEIGEDSMKDIRVTFANAEDEKVIKHLLAEVNLPHENLSNHLHNFLLAKSNDTLIGVVGLEVLGKFGLLRSLAVASPYCGRGIGKLLHEKILTHAHLQGIVPANNYCRRLFLYVGLLQNREKQMP